MLKVLHVINSLGPGGAEHQLLNVVANTNPRQFEHVICQLNGLETLADDVRATGSTVINLKLKGRRPWLRGAIALHRVFREEKPDLIQTWLFDSNISTRIAQLFSIRKIPNLVATQDLFYSRDVIRYSGW